MLISDWRFPSDSVMTARRVRSAESWRFIASWDVARRGDLADLDRGHFAAPALGDLVELDAQDLVDLLSRERTSSSRMSPMTARNVVVATPWRGGR